MVSSTVEMGSPAPCPGATLLGQGVTPGLVGIIRCSRYSCEVFPCFFRSGRTPPDGDYCQQRKDKGDCHGDPKTPPPDNIPREPVASDRVVRVSWPAPGTANKPCEPTDLSRFFGSVAFVLSPAPHGSRAVILVSALVGFHLFGSVAPHFSFGREERFNSDSPRSPTLNPSR